MRSILKLLSPVAVLACLAIPAAAAEQTADANWMRDYVELRVAAMQQKALGARYRGEAMQPRIVGGTVAPKNLNKFQVALLNRSKPNNFAAQFCGGTLISQQYIVTAAHCSDMVSPNQVAVLAGVRTLTTRGSAGRINVVSIDIHPGWNPETFANDVAVWKLAKPVRSVPAATLPYRGSDPSPDSMGTTTGWGTTSYGSNKSPTKLRAVTVPVVSRTVCNAPGSYDGSIESVMFCAGSPGKDSCQGDSGGPITANPANTSLIGIVSFGEGCGLADYPGVYTRVGEPSIYDFIKSAAGLP